LLFDLPSQKLHFLLYLLQGLLKLPCQCLDSDRLCKVNFIDLRFLEALSPNISSWRSLDFWAPK